MTRCVCLRAKSLRLDCRLPESSVHWIFQAFSMEWVAMPSSRGSSQPRDRICLLHRQAGPSLLAPSGKPYHILHPFLNRVVPDLRCSLARCSTDLPTAFREKKSASLDLHIDCRVSLEFRNVEVRGGVSVSESQEDEGFWSDAVLNLCFYCLVTKSCLTL